MLKQMHLAPEVIALLKFPEIHQFINLVEAEEIENSGDSEHGL